MTERLYYTDAYKAAFHAVVLEHLTMAGRPAVVLDRTAFYPTSGGQPHDTGRLAGAAVVEVSELDDGRVAHVLDRALPPDREVEGHVDWARRFDHMQQHTGQHLLSAAFEHLGGVRTVSFHLGADLSTIDLATPVDAAAIATVEDDANGIVWENRTISVRFASADEASALPLRKEPARAGTLRLVEVDGYDLSACGGTHVARTGAVGLIAVSGAERFKGGTRVEFVCGGRALARFRSLRAAVAASVRTLSVLPAELPSAIERLQADARAQKHEMRALQSRLVAYEADVLAGRAGRTGQVGAVLEAVAGWDVQGLKALAAAIAAKGGHVVVLVTDGAPASLVVARAAGVPVDANQLLRHLLGRFGGKGGGKPDLAQGGGLDAPPQEILDAARDWLSDAAGVSA